MSRCFISYRRDDSADVTGRLSDRLKSRFGPEAVFLDIDGIPLGVDFRRYLADEVNRCDVLLAVIGDLWLEATYLDGPKLGTRRLDDPDDFVRIEIEAALARGIPVVPLLVGRSALPRASDLPDSLKELAYRNAAAVRSGPDFDGQVDRLIRGLEQLLATNRKLREGVGKALHLAEEDPAMALGRARLVLDLMVRDLYERSFHEPPGTRSLENLVQRLDQEGFLPDEFDIAALLRQLAEARTADRGGGDAVTVTADAAGRALAQLTALLRWYIAVEQPGALALGPRQRPARRGKPGTSPIALGRETRIAVVPKGLRSFDADDAVFFLPLLPGPRDEEGLPESLRFWKHRIEPAGALTFAVGVLYGPSGCGKSSLVKAGLLPRLAPEIIAVYVEATPGETETRLLAGLRKRLPGLAPDLDLAQTLTVLRQGEGEGCRAGERPQVLLVLDQFEQWLHAHRGASGTALAQALRQCDGEQLRCVLMVRDDFWMALTRFLAELGVELLQGQNAAAVDLFDLIHARKVLTAFGQAFGRLPEDRRELTPEQSAFLDQATGWLAQDGRVISIRLALFAEMVKGKEWTPATLAEAGNMDRIGVAFLDETFRTPALRGHDKPAQAVLKALLPERGTDIKGHMRSYDELRAAAGESVRPEAFETLLRSLDRDVRLITPTDPEGQAGDEGKRPAAPEGKFYQLTHDYLVPSLREWLTRKQRETRRGRAELRLAERAALWRDRPENRFLPSAWEWCRIRLLTQQKNWTEPQRRMMRTAARVHGLRTLGLLVLVTALTVTGLAIRGRVIEDKQRTYAAGLVQRLLDADTPGVPAIIVAMKDYRRWVDPELRQQLPQLPEASHQKLHANLALLPDQMRVEYLYRRLLVAGPNELPVIWGLLQEHHLAPDTRLWAVVEDPRADQDVRFRAACALASSPAIRDARGWDAVSRLIADRLLAAILKNPSHYDPLIKSLRPVRSRLIAPLSETFRDPAKPESARALATSILADYAGDQPDVLADLLMDAAPDSFAILFPGVQAQASGTMTVLKAELSKTAGADAEPEKLHQRQARAAVALVRLGQVEDVCPLLRHSRDPGVRSFIVHWLKALGTDPRVLVAKLEGLAREPSLLATAEGTSRMEAILFDPVIPVRRALILALGEYYAEDLPAGMRDEVAAMLLDAYRNDPDAGIHGAAEWTLRQWNQDEVLKKVDTDMPALADRGDRRWFVNSQGQTLVLIEGPVRFLMGAPLAEPESLEQERPQHPQAIGRRFAVATKEVTRAQYDRFLQQNPKYPRFRIDQYSPDHQGPQVAVSWYDAAAYCNWLSEQEHLEACYEPNAKGEYAEGMKLAPDCLKRSGYRLPTEAEWEYVCRAGAVTSRSYGGSLELLRKYAWFLQNSPTTQANRCGRLKPNDLGLFDLLGNAWEWCLDAYAPYRQDGSKSDMIMS
jgi:formylglycine-generating enzyme required for sulfatase activity